MKDSKIITLAESEAGEQGNDRKALIVRRNDLIFAHHKMGLQEFRLFLLLMSRIKQGDESFKTERISMRELADLCGLEGESIYSEMRQITKRMLQRVVEIHDRDTKTLMQRQLLSAATYKYGEGYVDLCLHPDLKPYLLSLKEYFTSIEMNIAFRLKTRYAISLYEVLMAEKFKGDTVTFALAELRKVLGIEVDQYERFNNLRARVIDPATKEVSKQTDLAVGYSVERKGKGVDKVVFKIQGRRGVGGEVIGRSTEDLSKALRSVGMPENEAFRNVELWGATDPDRIIYHVQNCRLAKVPLAWLRSGLKKDFRPRGEQSRIEKAKTAAELEHDRDLKSRPHDGRDSELVGELLRRVEQRYIGESPVV